MMGEVVCREAHTKNVKVLCDPLEGGRGSIIGPSMIIWAEGVKHRPKYDHEILGQTLK